MTTAEPPIVPPGVVTQEFHTPRAVRRGVVAGVVGNMLEWYDFALFGFFAQQIGAHFFPAGALALLAYPLMALMARGETGYILAGQAGLALLVAAGSGALPATMAELAPWRVRCTVVAVAHNLGMALLGGTTPLVGAWLVARTGEPLAPAVYLAAAGAVSFVAALLLPRTAPHRLTREFESARFRS